MDGGVTGDDGPPKNVGIGATEENIVNGVGAIGRELPIVSQTPNKLVLRGAFREDVDSLNTGFYIIRDIEGDVTKPPVTIKVDITDSKGVFLVLERAMDEISKGALVRNPFVVEEDDFVSLMDNPSMATKVVFPAFHDAFPNPRDRLLGLVWTSNQDLRSLAGHPNELHNVRENAAKVSLSQDSPTSHVEEVSFPACQPTIHGIYDELEVLVGTLVVEDGESQVLTKGVTGPNIEDAGALRGFFSFEVGIKNNLRFPIVDALTRALAEIRHGGQDGVVVLGISSSEKSEIISKEEVGKPRSSSGNLDGVPDILLHFYINGSG
ncbi:hypothetical protein KY290_010787 [Solanum tuberosum]|uniref:Uncharacterized protein n=1 Tax=Solanum tuberosum TaxID=4113 RepID=A0ABQ7VYT5_SOLTU|nr:hypothetical protein KY290_010787 [Solanum tuberosum]